MKQYEVALMKHVEGSVDDDYVSMDFESADNYRDAVKIAKDRSKKWDACDVICFCETPETSYWQIFRETYVKGKKIYRTLFE